jgi:hypothetical protein
MWPDHTDDEVNRQIWAQFWEENPDADPYTVMSVIVALVAVIGIFLGGIALALLAGTWLIGGV